MEQLAIGWKTVLALIAGSGALTTLGVFLLARFTSVFDAYAGERAKLLAQFHNLDRLVKQTEKLTATTEAIKGQIADGIWDRQKKWETKRDFYMKSLEVMSEFRLSIIRLQKAQEDYEAGKRHPDHPAVNEYLDEAKRQGLAAKSNYDSQVTAFFRICNISTIFGSEDARNVLTAILLTCKAGLASPDQFERISTALTDGAIRFGLLASRDLGFEAPQPTANILEEP